MKIKWKTKEIQNKLLFFAVSVVVMLSAESVWLSNNPALFYMGAGTVLGLAWIKLLFRRLTVRQMYVLAAYWILGILYLLLKGEGSATGWTLFAVIFPLCFCILFKLTDGEELSLLRTFVLTVSVSAFLSVFLWFLASVLQVLPPTGTFTINWGGGRTIPSYFNLYFVTQGARRTLGPWIVTARNSGVFSEAPVTSFVFSLALLLNIFRCRYRQKFCNTVLVLAILSTYSTMGWIVLVLTAVSFALSHKTVTRTGTAFKCIFITAGVGIAVYLVYILLGNKIMSVSGAIRLRNLTEELQAFRGNILFGHGFGKYTYGSSNSITALLADGGIVEWGFYYVPILLTIVRGLKEKKIDFFMIIFACMFAMTVMHYTIISIFMITMFWRSLLRNSGH